MSDTTKDTAATDKTRGARIAFAGLLALCIMLSAGWMLSVQLTLLEHQVTRQLAKGISHRFGRDFSWRETSLSWRGNIRLSHVRLEPGIYIRQLEIPVGWRNILDKQLPSRITLVRPSFRVTVSSSVFEKLAKKEAQVTTPDVEAIQRPSKPRTEKHHQAKTKTKTTTDIEVIDGQAMIYLTHNERLLEVSLEGLYAKSPLREIAKNARHSIKESIRQSEIRIRSLSITESGRPMAQLKNATIAMSPTPRLAALGGIIAHPDWGPLLHVSNILIEEKAGDYRVRLRGNGVSSATDRARNSDATTLTLALNISKQRGESGTSSLKWKDARLELSRFPLESVLPTTPMSEHHANGYLSGTIDLKMKTRLLGADVNISAERLGIKSSLLSRETIGPTTIAIHGSAKFDGKKLTVDDLNVRLNDNIQFAGESIIELNKAAPRGKIELKSKRIACQTWLDSLPRGLAPKLAGMGLSGDLEVATKFDVDVANPDASSIDISLSPMTCQVVADAANADPNTLNQPLVMQLKRRNTTWILGPNNPDFRPLSRISPHVRAAFVAAEDNRFFKHDGFDRRQIKRALKQNLASGRIVRGASTLTQQLVKNLFLSHSRTLSRKIQEAVLTWRTEQVVSKDRILELYLNMIELGPGIRGVEQASQHFFGRPVKRLGALEAAHLAALAPSPRTYASAIDQHGADAAWMQKLRGVLKLMRANGDIGIGEHKRLADAKLKLK